MSGSRVAVVTGGAQGIGRLTAELLAERGWRVAIIDLNEPKAAVAAIESRGGEVLAGAGDITQEGTALRSASVTRIPQSPWIARPESAARFGPGPTHVRE